MVKPKKLHSPGKKYVFRRYSMTTITSTPTAVKEVSALKKRAHTVIENEKGKRKQLEMPAFVDDNTIELTENSIKVLEKRYLRRDLDGSVLESPAGMFYRVAYHVAQVESNMVPKVKVPPRLFMIC